MKDEISKQNAGQIEEEKVVPSLKRNFEEEEKHKQEEKNSKIEFIELETTGGAKFVYTPGGLNPPLPKKAKVSIVGDLTGGKLISMEHNPDGTFSKILNVKPGFKYTFCFQVDELMTIDANYPTYLTQYG